MGCSVLSALNGRPEHKGLIAYDPSPEALTAVHERFGVQTSSDLGMVINDPEVKLVFITAPNHAHRDLALAAMRAGKAVMLEKPIATTLEDSRLVVEESERLGTFLQIGFELRYSKLYAMVKQWIDAGQLGSIVNVHCTYICSEFHGKGSWRNALSTGGGMFGEKLCHYVDLPRWWTGSEVAEISTTCAPNAVPYYEVRDNYHCTWRFQNGAVGHLTFMMYVAETFEGDPLQNYVSQQMDDGHELRFLVVGTKGAAETDVFRRRARRWEFGDDAKSMTSRIVERHTWSETEDHRYFHDTTTQALDVMRRVAKGQAPFTSARDSLQTMILVEAAESSANLGKPLEITHQAAHAQG